MSEGYIYVLENQSLKKDIYKIGLTTNKPLERAKQLSNSTSIPSEFKVFYSKKTKNLNIAEKRIHLLLNEYRINPNKEFFQVKTYTIEKTIDKIVDDLEYVYNQSYKIYIHEDLIYSNYIPKLTLNGDRILDTLMTYTTQNTIVNQVIGFNDDITNGFLSNSFLVNLLNISHNHSLNIMREFVRKYSNLQIKFLKKNIQLTVFKDLRYSRGEMSWVFNDEFRKYFYNEHF